MMLTRLLETLIGPGEEFESVTIYLNVEVLAEAVDLSAQIGVPTSRLLAELIPPALTEARSEWRMLSHGILPDPEPAPTSLSLSLPPRVK